uniref:Uncharacterized protein n=1 Tax=Lygus hesperus TaxID=30085 RepID=A0A146KYJ6_LYGHE
MCCEGLIEKLPQLNTCCCCCKVETGSKVIAWLDAIVATLSIIVAILGIIGGGGGTGVIVAAVIMIIAMVAMLVMAVVLLLGLYREEKEKVECWLRVSCCLLFLLIASETVSVVSAAVSLGVESAISAVISALIVILYKFYEISVVKSHHYNMINGFGEGRV